MENHKKLCKCQQQGKCGHSWYLVFMLKGASPHLLVQPRQRHHPRQDGRQGDGRGVEDRDSQGPISAAGVPDAGGGGRRQRRRSPRLAISGSRASERARSKTGARTAPASINCPR